MSTNKSDPIYQLISSTRSSVTELDFYQTSLAKISEMLSQIALLPSLYLNSARDYYQLTLNWTSLSHISRYLLLRTLSRENLLVTALQSRDVIIRLNLDYLLTLNFRRTYIENIIASIEADLGPNIIVEEYDRSLSNDTKDTVGTTDTAEKA